MFQPKNIINKPKKWIGECSRRKGKGYHRVSPIEWKPLWTSAFKEHDNVRSPTSSISKCSNGALKPRGSPTYWTSFLGWALIIAQVLTKSSSISELQSRMSWEFVNGTSLSDYRNCFYVMFMLFVTWLSSTPFSFRHCPPLTAISISSYPNTLLLETQTTQFSHYGSSLELLYHW
jgi:hypothetical protein